MRVRLSSATYQSVFRAEEAGAAAGKGMYESMCAWAKDNYALWKPWIKNPRSSILPIVSRVSPTVVAPGGTEKVVIRGQYLYGTRVNVFIGTKLCQNAVSVSDEVIECVPPDGTESDLPIRVQRDGVSSAPAATSATLSYRVPQVDTLNHTWVVPGSQILVTGVGFSPAGTVQCKTGAALDAPVRDGVFVSTTQVICPAGEVNDDALVADAASSGSATASTGVVKHDIYVSQDGGFRWSSPAQVSVGSPPIWTDGSSYPPRIAKPPPTVKLGLLFESSCHQSARDAVTAINKDEGLLRGTEIVPIDLPYTDHATAINRSKVAVMQDGVICIVGVESSGLAERVAEELYATNYNVPLISAWATSDSLSSQSRFPAFVRVVFRNSDLALAMVQLMTHFKWRRIGIMTQNSVYANGLREQIVSSWRSANSGLNEVLFLRTFIQEGDVTDSQREIMRTYYDDMMKLDPAPRVMVFEASKFSACAEMVAQLAEARQRAQGIAPSKLE